MLSQKKADSWTASLLGSLREALGSDLEYSLRSDIPGLVRLDLGVDDFKAVLPGVRAALSKASVDSFDDLFVFESSVATEIIIRFYASRIPGRELRLGLIVKPGARPRLPRVSTYWPSARSCENEIGELFGFQFEDAEGSPVSFSIDLSAASANSRGSRVAQAGGEGGERS